MDNSSSPKSSTASSCASTLEESRAQTKEEELGRKDGTDCERRRKFPLSPVEASRVVDTTADKNDDRKSKSPVKPQPLVSSNRSGRSRTDGAPAGSMADTKAASPSRCAGSAAAPPAAASWSSRSCPHRGSGSPPRNGSDRDAHASQGEGSAPTHHAIQQQHPSIPQLAPLMPSMVGAKDPSPRHPPPVGSTPSAPTPHGQPGRLPFYPSMAQQGHPPAHPHMPYPSYPYGYPSYPPLPQPQTQPHALSSQQHQQYSLYSPPQQQPYQGTSQHQAWYSYPPPQHRQGGAPYPSPSYPLPPGGGGGGIYLSPPSQQPQQRPLYSQLRPGTAGEGPGTTDKDENDATSFSSSLSSSSQPLQQVQKEKKGEEQRNAKSIKETDEPEQRKKQTLSSPENKDISCSRDKEKKKTAVSATDVTSASSDQKKKETGEDGADGQEVSKDGSGSMDILASEAATQRQGVTSSSASVNGPGRPPHQYLPSPYHAHPGGAGGAPLVPYTGYPPPPNVSSSKPGGPMTMERSPPPQYYGPYHPPYGYGGSYPTYMPSHQQPYMPPYTAATMRPGGSSGYASAPPPSYCYYPAITVPGVFPGMHGFVTPPPSKRQKSCGSLSSHSSSPTVSTPASAVGVNARPPSSSPTYSRKDKSLGLMCENFMARYGSSDAASSMVAASAGISIDEAAMTLGVERRRIYDIINILESINVVSRRCKNTYNWHGTGHLPSVFASLQREAFEIWPDDAKRFGLLPDELSSPAAGGYSGLGTGYGERKKNSNSVAVATLAAATEVASSSSASSQPTIMSSRSWGDQIVKPEEAAGQKEKSLGKLTQRFLQLFLVGYDVISLNEASGKILGRPEDLAFLSKRTRKRGGLYEDPEAARAAAARGLKTKVRRLYDIANVMVSVGIVVKVSSGNSLKGRPSFRWVYGVKPSDLLKLHEVMTGEATRVEETTDARKDLPGNSREPPLNEDEYDLALLSALISTGANRASDIDWSALNLHPGGFPARKSRWDELISSELGEEDDALLGMPMYELAKILLSRKKEQLAGISGNKCLRTARKDKLSGDAQQREGICRERKNKTAVTSDDAHWSSPLVKSDRLLERNFEDASSSTSKLMAGININGADSSQKSGPRSVPITPIHRNGSRRDVDVTPQVLRRQEYNGVDRNSTTKEPKKELEASTPSSPNTITPQSTKDSDADSGSTSVGQCKKQSV